MNRPAFRHGHEGRRARARILATALIMLSMSSTVAAAAGPGPQGGPGGKGPGAGGGTRPDIADHTPLTPDLTAALLPLPPAPPAAITTAAIPTAATPPVPAGDYRALFALPAAVHRPEDLAALARLMIRPDTPKDGPDGEENTYVPAGYTYLGQFVDHDLTFDPVSVLGVPTRTDTAHNARTPKFDLDNLYGLGPDLQPYLYGHDAKGDLDGTLVEGALLDNGVRDVPRNAQGVALIGDPRNDENEIVIQMHALFLHLHNTLARQAQAGTTRPPMSGRQLLAWTQREVQHTYQRLLLDDFLPRVVDTHATTVQALFRDLEAGRRPTPRWYPTGGTAFIPREFALAAYRFGHSMIRPGYRLSDRAPDLLLPIFPTSATGKDSLMGMRPLDRRYGIDWSLFFDPDLPAGTALDDAGRADNDARNTLTVPPFHRRVQFAYKIDTAIVDAITVLPGVAIPGAPSPVVAPDLQHSLAVRNLMRGLSFGLPSGEAVAAAMGLPPLTADQISIRPDDEEDKKRELIADRIPSLRGNTPLWFYILAEADQYALQATLRNPQIDTMSIGTRLGPMGGAIVAETFVGLMLLDPESVLNQPKPWRSAITGSGHVTMADILHFIKAIA